MNGSEFAAIKIGEKLFGEASAIIEMPSVSLPWEIRRRSQIYIAAPDFDYLDQTAVEKLVACLRYHNFSPRLPVRENGQAHDGMTEVEKRKLYDADMALLKKCELLIAVNLYDDAGTMIEIGIAHEMGIPVIVYDPQNKARNVMLTQAPDFVSASLEKVVTTTFDMIARRCGKN